jgi:hypothetical protein
MDQVGDANGQARAALARVVQGFGAPVLGQADLLEGLLNDDVPQLPRQIALLTEAARCGMAGSLMERIRQGVSTQAAISMVASEVTSRSAMDTAGALWAAEVFADALGYQVPGPAQAVPAQAVPAQPVPAPAGPAQAVPEPAPPTKVLGGGPTVTDPGRLADNQETIRPTGQQWPAGQQWLPVQQSPGGSELAPIPVGLAAIAAVLTGVGVLLQLFWGAIPRSHPGSIVFWASNVILIIGGAVLAIWVARDRVSGSGLAAVLGLAAPAVAFNIYNAAFAVELSDVSSAERHLLVTVSALSLIAALTAMVLAIATLASRRRAVKRKADPLSIILVIAGLAFPLTQILAQQKFLGTEFDYILGQGVRGWFILWGLLFIVLFALPPLLSGFLPTRLSQQLALWTGWLLIVAVWQISDTPVGGYEAAPGLIVSWLVWLAVLIGTLVLALRGTGDWPGNPA